MKVREWIKKTDTRERRKIEGKVDNIWKVYEKVWEDEGERVDQK